MLKYEQAKRRRIKRFFTGVTNFDGYWWYEDQKMWLKGVNGNCSTHVIGVRTVRAFRRHLRKCSKYLPKGVEFVLVSRYIGHNAYGKI